MLRALTHLDDGSFAEQDASVFSGNRISDQATAVAMAWTPLALHCAIKCVDDIHQDPGSADDGVNMDKGNGGWKGDSLQLMFTHASRTASDPANDQWAVGEDITNVAMLYSYGLHQDKHRTHGHDYQESGTCCVLHA